MNIKTVVAVGLFLATAPAFGQAASSSCMDDLTKLEGDNHRVRVSTGVLLYLAEKKVLPDVSDLKHSKTKSDVLVRLAVGKGGVVRCAEATEGDTQLWQRSVEAAKQWRFKPYMLNGEPVIVDTGIRFVFRKGKVSVQQP